MLCLFWNSPQKKYWAIRNGLPAEERVKLFMPGAYYENKRIALAATDKTLAIIQKKYFKKVFIYNHWNRFAYVELEEVIWFSNVKFKLFGGKSMVIANLKKEEARVLHGLARKYIEKHEAKKIAVGKTCPFCSEVIKYTASICPHCLREQPKS